MNRHLAFLVLASALPAAFVAAAVVASLYDRVASIALWLSLGMVALVGGIAVSVALARDLERMLNDLATSARCLASGLPLGLLTPAVREGAAIAGALDAAAARLKKAPLSPSIAPRAPVLPRIGSQRFAAAPLLEAALRRLKGRASLAGITVVADLHGAAGWIAGDAAALEEALATLVDHSLLLAPRGSVATLSAARRGGALSIVLRWQAAAGMRLAAGMVELRSGLDGSAGLAAARAAIAALGGTLETLSDAAGETVAIALPLVLAERQAAA